MNRTIESLSDEEVEQIRTRIKCGDNIDNLSASYNVTIADIEYLTSDIELDSSAKNSQQLALQAVQNKIIQARLEGLEKSAEAIRKNDELKLDFVRKMQPVLLDKTMEIINGINKGEIEVDIPTYLRLLDACDKLSKPDAALLKLQLDIIKEQNVLLSAAPSSSSQSFAGPQRRIARPARQAKGRSIE